MNTEMVAAFRYRHEGEFAQATLESAGIRCILTADDGGGTRPEIMGVNPVRIYVSAEDADEARALLAGDDGVADDDATADIAEDDNLVNDS